MIRLQYPTIQQSEVNRGHLLLGSTLPVGAALLPGLDLRVCLDSQPPVRAKVDKYRTGLIRPAGWLFTHGRVRVGNILVAAFFSGADFLCLFTDNTISPQEAHLRYVHLFSLYS